MIPAPLAGAPTYEGQVFVPSVHSLICGTATSLNSTVSLVLQECVKRHTVFMMRHDLWFSPTSFFPFLCSVLVSQHLRGGGIGDYKAYGTKAMTALRNSWALLACNSMQTGKGNVFKFGSMTSVRSFYLHPLGTEAHEAMFYTLYFRLLFCRKYEVGRLKSCTFSPHLWFHVLLYS